MLDVRLALQAGMLPAHTPQHARTAAQDTTIPMWRRHLAPPAWHVGLATKTLAVVSAVLHVQWATTLAQLPMLLVQHVQLASTKMPSRSPTAILALLADTILALPKVERWPHLALHVDLAHIPMLDQQPAVLAHSVKLLPALLQLAVQHARMGTTQALLACTPVCHAAGDTTRWLV